MGITYKKKLNITEDLFKNSFLESSMMLDAKLKFEKLANVSNMDSGIPLEDFFRDEFSKHIPNAFSIDTATIVDRQNYTCGECDFIIYDSNKSTFIKQPVTEKSRRKYLFNESVYGVIEIKQTLKLGKRLKKEKSGKKFDGGSLKSSMEKLFSYKQLDKESYINKYIGAEIPGTDEVRYLSNKPFSMAFFYDTDIDMDSKEELELLVEEFYAINIEQPIEERVNGIYVLNKFMIGWTQDNNKFLAYHPSDAKEANAALAISKENTLYNMYIMLANILRISETTVPIFNRDYGGAKYLSNFEGMTFNGTKEAKT